MGIALEDSSSAKLFLPPAAGQLRLLRWFPTFFGAELGSLTAGLRLVRAFTVAPQAQFTSLSAFEYQVYLNRVFHTHALGWWGHALQMPLVVLGIFWSSAQVPFGHHAWLNGSVVAAAVIGAWWVAWAVVRRDLVWGIGCAGLLVLLWSAANMVARHVAGSDWDHPIAFTWLMSSGVAWSHLREPRMPPRATFTDRWMTIGEFWASRGPGLAATLRCALFLFAYTFVFAPINEFFASPRLCILYLKELQWFLGHRRAERDALRALSERALASGNPAVDFVGVGGGNPLPTMIP
jgi:hypothetical protein